MSATISTTEKIISRKLKLYKKNVIKATVNFSIVIIIGILTGWFIHFSATNEWIDSYICMDGPFVSVAVLCGILCIIGFVRRGIDCITSIVRIEGEIIQVIKDGERK